MPHQRATRKWPSSWKKTTMVRTNRNGMMYPVKPPPNALILRKDIQSHRALVRPSPRARLVTESLLGCLYGDFGQEVLGKRSRNMVNGERFIDVGRLAQQPARCRRPRSSPRTSAGIPAEADPAIEEFGNRDLVGGIEHRRRARRRSRAPRARAPAPETAPGRALRRSDSPFARDRAAAAPSIRSGQARQWAIGTRMSGGPSCATIEPSRNSTSPCTIDCGCTNTSISDAGKPNR